MLALILILCAFSDGRRIDDIQSKFVDVGKKVNQWTTESKVNPEELGEYFEGDIVRAYAKNGLTNADSKWPKGEVPYEFLGTFSLNDLEVIKNAFQQYHKYSCIRFRPRMASDVDYLSITNDWSGCWSSVGRAGGRQPLNLQAPNCMYKTGTVIHELLHALGFHHEQNRFDRDDYVTINWNNIIKGREANFEKVHETQSFGVSYDYNSVLHYSEYAFSDNNKPTITSKEVTSHVIGQREGFSKGDLDKLRLMYGCQPSDHYPVLQTSQKDDFLSSVIHTFFPQKG